MDWVSASKIRRAARASVTSRTNEQVDASTKVTVAMLDVTVEQATFMVTETDGP